MTKSRSARQIFTWQHHINPRASLPCTNQRSLGIQAVWHGLR